MLHMVPEIGHFALILALCLAVAQTGIPALGVATRRTTWMQQGSALASLQFIALLFSFACLT